MAESMTHIQLACFTLGDRLFAVDIMRIREIAAPRRLSPLPRDSDLLVGVIELRGTVIPVMDLRDRFGMPPARAAEDGMLVVVSLARQQLALAVDEVSDVMTVPVAGIHAPVDMTSEAGIEFILGVCLAGERVVMILNIDALLGSGPPVIP